MNKSSNATVTRILRGLAVAATGLALGAYAAVTPVIDGGTYTFTVASGTETYSTVLSGAIKVVKEGAGTLVLDTASTGFTGTVVVKAGTLKVSDKDALGATTVPISVESGARLLLSLPGNTQFGHVVTIAGTGDTTSNPYAFDYSRSDSSGNSDSLIDGLILAGDATVVVRNGQRWGVKTGGTIELNGHTLTRKGSGQWMIKGITVQSTVGAGTVVNSAGTLTFQGTPQVAANVTFDITGGLVGLWAVETTAAIEGTIKLSNNSAKIQAQESTKEGANRLGNVYFAASATNLTTYSNSARSMTIHNISGASSVAPVINGIGSLYVTGNVNLGASGNFMARGGYLHFKGDDAVRDLNLRVNATNTTTHAAGTTFLRSLRVANQGLLGQLRQTGGVIGVRSSDAPRIGEANGQRAYFTLEGGEFHASNAVWIAEKKGSFGAFRQTGGYFESYGRTKDAVYLHIGRGGDALFVQTGGTNDIAHTGSDSDQDYRTLMGSTNGTVAATISGTGTEFRTSGFQMGGNSAALTTNILNLADGGTLKINRFQSSPKRATGSLTVVNSDGGVFAPTYAGDVTKEAAGTNPDKFVVWNGGLIVDTSENSLHSGTGTSTLPFTFSKPSGKGVESIALPAVSATYIGIGRVVIEDTTGWGASAYAEYNFATKRLTGIVVTSRGCDYSDNAKAYLESPDGKSRTECALTLSSNEGLCGPIVKRGSPQLILSGTVGTFDGGYAVEEGSLQLRSAVSDAIQLRVESGATLDLYSQGGISATTFEGPGTVVNGAVTVTGTLKAKCADIFAGSHAAFGDSLVFGDNAVFEITDAENLPTYKNEATAVALTATSISRQPALRLTKSDGTPYAGSDADQWVLTRSSDGKTLKFGCPKPFTLVVR